MSLFSGYDGPFDAPALPIMAAFAESLSNLAATTRYHQLKVHFEDLTTVADIGDDGLSTRRLPCTHASDGRDSIVLAPIHSAPISSTSRAAYFSLYYAVSLSISS